MSTTTNEVFYEWVKGDYIGTIERIASENLENGINWVKFESGRRINRDLFGEFLLISETGVSSIDPVSSSPVPVSSPPTNQVVENHNKIEKKEVESPISILLKSQKKKKKEKITLEFELELPSPEMLLIMYESFGDDLFSEIYKMNLKSFEDSLPTKFEESIKSHLKIK